MGKLISESLRYVSKMTLGLVLKFPSFLRINLSIIRRNVTQQNLLVLIVAGDSRLFDTRNSS